MPVSLRDERFFPPLEACPGDHVFDQDYYRRIEPPFGEPSKHWCLLAEIQSFELFIRPRIIAKDKNGEAFVLAFYHDPSQHLDISVFKPGHTIAILYPHYHHFLDGTGGIREERVNGFQMIPCKLARAFLLNDIAISRTREPSLKCNCCDKTENVRKCGRYGLAQYYGKECQTKDWTENGHSRDCLSLKVIQTFRNRDWANWTDFWNTPL